MSIKLNEIAFVHVPKNAGSSIRTTYPEFVSTHKTKLKHVHGSLEHLDKPYKKAFGVLRNPYEWLFSLYTFTKHSASRNRWAESVGCINYDAFIKTSLPVIEKKLDHKTQSDWLKGIPDSNIVLFDNVQVNLNNFLIKAGVKGDRIRTLKRVNDFGNKKKTVNEDKISPEAKIILDKYLANDIELYERLRKK